MLYLSDADVLIRADRVFYPPDHFPVFWDWLLHMGEVGNFKIPLEQYEEIVTGKGPLVDWLKKSKDLLLLPEESDVELVAKVTAAGYGRLDEKGVELVGRDPFLIAYGVKVQPGRTVVTLEVSAPSKKNGNRKIPDVCSDLHVPCCDLFQVIRALKFSTSWKHPGVP
jgi:hypothetical protein